MESVSLFEITDLYTQKILYDGLRTLRSMTWLTKVGHTEYLFP